MAMKQQSIDPILNLQTSQILLIFNLSTFFYQRILGLHVVLPGSGSSVVFAVSAGSSVEVPAFRFKGNQVIAIHNQEVEDTENLGIGQCYTHDDDF